MCIIYIAVQLIIYIAVISPVYHLVYLQRLLVYLFCGVGNFIPLIPTSSVGVREVLKSG